tara:strand:+ start:453 stop:1007 length:555 start_codon:yes stop_codon:yes gene_type:complete
MKKILIIFFLFCLTAPLNASVKDQIISNLKKTENLTFNFKQTIGEKTEEGNCVIKYPKKIYCSYNNLNKKIMVSNGKSLVIKNKINNQYYIYPLKRTPLELILDKNYLINEIKNLKARNIEDKFINFTLENNDNKINIFFDIITLNLIGWQTEDIYQNLVITYISKIKLNQKIDKNIFNLPKMN